MEEILSNVLIENNRKLFYVFLPLVVSVRRHWSICPPPIAQKQVNPRPHLLFRHHRPHLGGGGSATPRLVCPLIQVKLHNKYKRKDRDVLNLTIPDLIP